MRHALRSPSPPPLHEFNLDAKLPTEVQDVFHQAEAIYPEWGLDWFRNLAHNGLAQGETALCFGIGQGMDTIILPVRFTQEEGVLRSLSNYYTSLFSPLAVGVPTLDNLAYLFRGLAQDRRGWHSLSLYPMAQDDPMFRQTLSALRAGGWLAFPYYGFGNWYMPVAKHSFAEYYAGLSSRLRNTAERKEKKFLAGGRGQITLVCDETGVETAISAWEKIYNASWKRPEPYPRFMPGLIRMCSARGWLRLGLAHYDGEPVAAQVWIVHASKACIYKLAYDEKYSKLSAGTVLSKFLMRHVLDEDRVAEVDYLIGDDEYKKDWMSHRRERWGIVAYNPRTMAGLLGASRESVGRMVKRVMGRASAGNRQLIGMKHDGSHT